MNFIELLEHSKVDKSIIDDFGQWLFHIKDIKGYSINTYRSYCYDVCDFFLFYQYYHQVSLSQSNLKNLDLQTFRAWVADIGTNRNYINVYKNNSAIITLAIPNDYPFKPYQIQKFDNNTFHLYTNN